MEELFKGCVNEPTATLKMEALSPSEMPIVITRPEFMRRMQEMSAMQGMSMNMGDMYNVVVNTNHPLMNSILENNDADKANYLYAAARLQNGMLKGADMTAFIKKSIEMIK